MSENLVRVPDDYSTGGSGLNPRNGSLRFTSLVKVLQGIYDAVAPVIGLVATGSTQFGTLTLGAGGTVAVTSARVTAGSQILLQMLTPAGTRTNFVNYALSAITPGAAGASTFTVTAVAADGTTAISGARDVVSFLVVG